MWKRALETSLDIPSPNGHGSERKDDQLSVVWTKNHPPIESVLEFTTRACHKSNCTNVCQCSVLSMECTDVFKCRGFVDTLFIIQSKVMMWLMSAMKMVMLTRKLRIFDTLSQLIYLDLLTLGAPCQQGLFIPTYRNDIQGFVYLKFIQFSFLWLQQIFRFLHTPNWSG